MTTGGERQAEQLRPTPMLIAAVAVLAGSILLFAVNLDTGRTSSSRPPNAPA